MGFGIWDFKRGNTGFEGAGVGEFCNGRFAGGEFSTGGAKLGFRIIGPPGWCRAVANSEFGRGSSHEETGGIGARTQGIERHPVL